MLELILTGQNIVCDRLRRRSPHATRCHAAEMASTSSLEEVSLVDQNPYVENPTSSRCSEQLALLCKYNQSEDDLGSKRDVRNDVISDTCTSVNLEV